MSSTLYYADTFTSILRWVILFTIALAIVVVVHAMYRTWRPKKRAWWRPEITVAERRRREYDSHLS